MTEDIEMKEERFCTTCKWYGGSWIDRCHRPIMPTGLPRREDCHWERRKGWLNSDRGKDELDCRSRRG